MVESRFFNVERQDPLKKKSKNCHDSFLIATPVFREIFATYSNALKLSISVINMK